MARRIEIELTSARPDGTWTWRAAGAREPRGVLVGGLLPAGAKAGDVLRAEAEFEIDGITIVSVLAPKESNRPEPQRIEIIGSGRGDVPAVTTQLVGRGDRRPGDRRRDRDEGRPRRERDGGRPNGRDTTRPRREGPPGEEDSQARERTRPARPERGAGTEGAERPARSERPPRSDRPPPSERPPRSERHGTAERRDRPAGSGRDGEDAARGRPAGRPARGERPAQKASGRASTAAAPAERRARRLTPGRTHRQAILASLPPEQQPIAEQVLRGGIPAVRTALHLEREKAMAEGRPVPNTDQLVAMAESLLPRLKAAEWRDRAEAAAKDVDEISLRDLRSVVAGADVARDEETRALAAGLREALDRRVEALRSEWSDEIAKQLDDNKVVRALRLAARPPEPAARLDPTLSERLSDAAGQALAADAPAERWLAVLDAVAASPVRRSVKPAGLPSDATPEVRRVAHQQSGRIPALAAMLGVSMPPPPVATPNRRAPARRRSRTAGAASGPPGAAAEPSPVSDETTGEGPAPADQAGPSGPPSSEDTPVQTAAAPADQAGSSEPPTSEDIPGRTTGAPADEAGSGVPPTDGEMAAGADVAAASAIGSAVAPGTDAGPPPDAVPGPPPDAVPAQIDGGSAERGQDAVVVQELGESVNEG